MTSLTEMETKLVELLEKDGYVNVSAITIDGILESSGEYVKNNRGINILCTASKVVDGGEPEFNVFNYYPNENILYRNHNEKEDTYDEKIENVL